MAPPIAARGEAADTDDGDKDSAYFQYYALLTHQAQMMQDVVRTSSYQKAILANAEQCFRDKIIIDVGAGNGILSIFSAQAGARKVYAIEASNMVENLQHFVNASHPAKKPARSSIKNSWVGERVVPVHSKMESVTADMMDGNEKCDTIVSECLGVVSSDSDLERLMDCWKGVINSKSLLRQLLVHERMCESFIDARDQFLKPGGTVLPSAGTICLAPIEDKVVWEEAANKARFWENKNFYGVDVTPFADAAWEEAFSSPVVGCFGPLVLLSTSNNYNVDFLTISKEDLKRFVIPLSFDIAQTAVVHGLAGWFDLHFLPPPSAPFSAEDALAMEEVITASTPELEMKMASTSHSNSSDATIDLGFGIGSSSNTSEALRTNTTSQVVDPTISSSYMTTSPYATPTHWQQVRFLFQEPLAINKGQRIVGEMLCEVNDYRSYTLTAELKIEGTNDELLTRHCHWRLDRQVYSWTSASPSTQ